MSDVYSDYGDKHMLIAVQYMIVDLGRFTGTEQTMSPQQFYGSLSLKDGGKRHKIVMKEASIIFHWFSIQRARYILYPVETVIQ